MRILVDIGHPAHVHFFKNFIWEMEKRGHAFIVTARDKDVALRLLKAYGIEHTVVGRASKGKFGLITEWVERDRKIYAIARRFRPDILTGIHNPCVAHVSRVTGAKSIVFTDTEHAKIANLVTFPFADVICTPSCFKKDLGKKQVRYNGYHELAYLHPNYFKPDPSVLDELGIKETDKYVIVRFVSWDASHDINLCGLTNKKELVEKLEKYAEVFITSESEISGDLRKYKMMLSPEKLHSALHYANLHIGDGATTAVEAALLGTPTVHFEAFKSKSKKFIDATRFGILDELANKYQMLHTFADQDKAVNKALELLQDKNAKKDWRRKRERLLSEKIDVTEFMVNLVENYPESLQAHKSDT